MAKLVLNMASEHDYVTLALRGAFAEIRQHVSVLPEQGSVRIHAIDFGKMQLASRRRADWNKDEVVELQLSRGFCITF